MRRLLAALLASLLLGWSPAVWAHAALLASEPADGASLAAAPAAVILRFDEPVTPLALRLAGPGLGAVPLPAPGKTLRVGLPPGLGEGVYVVSWRVTSADGHPVAGALAFGVGRAAVPAAMPDASAMANWDRALLTLRFAFTLAFAVVAGGALFRALIAEPPRHVRRGLAIIAGIGIACVVASIGCLGGLFTEGQWGALLLAVTWRIGLGTSFATSLGVSAIGLAVCGVSMLRLGRAARLLGAAGAVVAALGFPLAGHAATAEQHRLAVAALVAHVLAIAFWLGAFWPLRALLVERGGSATVVLMRFSRGALLAVPMLLAAGITLATLRLPSWAAVLASDYGRLILVKALGVALLLALAVWNRQWLTPALTGQKPGAERRLRRSILVEMAIATLVLGTTAVLVRTPPPGAADHHSGHTTQVRDIAVATELQGRSVLLVLAPGEVGANRITLATGNPAPAEAWVELEQPALGIGPLRRRLEPDARGGFALDAVTLIAPGRWTVRLELLIGDFELLTGEVALDLSPEGTR
ncbi:MAG: copper resistance CopC/CopD family protein [Paracraurococcus sp.]